MCLQVARGLAYLSAEGVLHRDLAARNVLLDVNDRCKLADFGLARRVEEDGVYMVKSAFPVRWTAPEILVEKSATSASDVFSLGITLWEIFSDATLPYSDLLTNSAVSVAVTSGVRPTRPASMPDSVFVLVERCWEGQPENRPSAAEVAGALEIIIEGADDSTGGAGYVTSAPSHQSGTTGTYALPSGEVEMSDLVTTDAIYHTTT